MWSFSISAPCETDFIPLTLPVMRQDQCEHKSEASGLLEEVRANPKSGLWRQVQEFTLLIKLTVELPQHTNNKLLQCLVEIHKMQDKKCW